MHPRLKGVFSNTYENTQSLDNMKTHPTWFERKLQHLGEETISKGKDHPWGEFWKRCQVGEKKKTPLVLGYTIH